MQLYPLMADPHFFFFHLYLKHPFFICHPAYDPDLLLRIYHHAVANLVLLGLFLRDSLLYFLYLRMRRFLQFFISFHSFYFNFSIAAIGRLCRPAQHVSWHSQFPGDIKGAALPSLSDDQLIKRLQTFLIKGHSCIDDPFCSAGILFYLRIMRGSQK